MKKVFIVLVYIYVFLITMKNCYSDVDAMLISTHQNIKVLAQNHMDELSELNIAADLNLAEALAMNLTRELGQNKKNNGFNQKLIITNSNLRQQIKKITENYKQNISKLLIDLKKRFQEIINSEKK